MQEQGDAEQRRRRASSHNTKKKSPLSVGSNLHPTPPPTPPPPALRLLVELPFLFCCQSPLPSNFFLLLRFSFQAAPPLKPLVPIIHRGFFFDASFMVLFPNALHLTLSPPFTATPSNLHHWLLCGVAASTPAALLSCLGFLCFYLLFTPSLILSSGLLLPTSSFSTFFYAPTLVYPSHSLFHYYHFSPSILSPFSRSSLLLCFPST